MHIPYALRLFPEIDAYVTCSGSAVRQITVRTALESQAAAGCGTYTRQQTEVLLLFQAYANIFTKGALKNAINRARNIRTWLDLGGNETGDVEVSRISGFQSNDLA